MITRLLILSLLLGLVLSLKAPTKQERDSAIAALPRVDTITRGYDGDATVLFGDLGTISPVTEQSVSSWIASNRVVFRLSGSEELRLRKIERVKESSTVHFYFDEYLRGIAVVGGELFVHVKENGNVFGVTSNLLADGEDALFHLPANKKLLAVEIIRLVLKGLEILEYNHVDDIALKYVIDPHTDKGHLAYTALITTRQSDNAGLRGHEQPIRVYASAHNYKLIYAEHLVQGALNRTIWTANNLDTLPGVLVRTEDQRPVNDQSANQAFNNSGICYEYLKTVFNRDSYNGKGAPLNSTVHYKVDYNNAFWNGEQMVYGDGDGVTFTDFAGDLTVVCHELTHALTSSTANLLYLGESGALNEAMSDIFGASTAIWYKDPANSGITPTSWLIGPECYLAGEALRYMNNPPLDGISRDFYPDRYRGIQDNFGVHINSGIANLAYVLLSQGGVHPQQKTSNWVIPVGVQTAQRIFYVSLTQYMTSSTKFEAARSITEEVSKTLFDNPSITNSVSNAWAAVGVGAVPAPLPPQ